MVVELTVVLATKSRRGIDAIEIVERDDAAAEHQALPPRVKSPRRKVRPPMTVRRGGTAGDLKDPPISASRPRPRTKIACGAWMSSASRIGVAAAVPAAAGPDRPDGGGGAAPGLLISRTSIVG